MINWRLFPLLFILTILLFKAPSYSQNKKESSSSKKKPNNTKTATSADKATQDEIESYKQKVGRMVSFLEFALNTIGSDSSSADDKEVIINRSFLKFFNDAKVQVEDDLDNKRTSVTYKNVQSYLQDLDYFFKDAKFELSVDAITSDFSNDKHPYFIAEVTRYLKAITVEGDTIRNSKKRFIEVNLDLKNKDLKIVSIYTTRYNEDEVLIKWWNDLNPDWKRIFNGIIKTNDSIQVPHIKRLLMTDSLDISKINTLRNIDPLSRFLNLKYLNISSTRISDLTPIRNLIHLESLNCSFTAVTSLVPLKYTAELKELYINNTSIIDISPISVFKNLLRIDFHSCPISNIYPLSNLQSLEVINGYSTPLYLLTPLKNLKNLKFLNVSNTSVEKLDSLNGLENLKELDLSFTRVNDLSPISSLKSLSVLNINNTPVRSLKSLKNIETLTKIYCDNTSISKDEANNFMTSKPKVLVIHQSIGLFEWWRNLEPFWQSIFRKYVSVHGTPTVEEMASLANLTEIDISGIKEIKSLAPLKPLSNLKALYANNTPLESIYDIEGLTQLQIIELSSTQVRDITPLSNFTNLKRLNVDNTPIKTDQLEILVKANPQCLVIYKTASLIDWWARLPLEWKEVLQKNLNLKSSTPTTIELHQMVQSDTIKIENNSKIKDLSPLGEFLTLQHLEIHNCMVENLDVVIFLQRLKHLRLSKNPIKNIEQLRALSGLEYLDLENTGVSDIEVLQFLTKLRHLNLAGTPIKDIKDLEKLYSLNHLDISSTAVSSLSPIEKISNIQQLKCFNSKLSLKKVNNFKKEQPQCEVVYY